VEATTNISLATSGAAEILIGLGVTTGMSLNVSGIADEGGHYTCTRGIIVSSEKIVSKVWPFLENIKLSQNLFVKVKSLYTK
jgi:hypothetical protein